MEELSIALPPGILADVRAAVAGGDYRSVSEVVSDALYDWRLRRKLGTQRTEELRDLLQEGIDSGPDLDTEEVFARLRTRFGHPPGR